MMTNWIPVEERPVIVYTDENLNYDILVTDKIIIRAIDMDGDISYHEGYVGTDGFFHEKIEDYGTFMIPLNFIKAWQPANNTIGVS